MFTSKLTGGVLGIVSGITGGAVITNLRIVSTCLILSVLLPLFFAVVTSIFAV